MTQEMKRPSNPAFTKVERPNAIIGTQIKSEAHAAATKILDVGQSDRPKVTVTTAQ
jgi:hypothetical protein